MKRAALLMLLLLTLGGCGQSGDLFIPAEPDEESETESGAGDATAPGEDEEEDDEEEETGPR